MTIMKPPRSALLPAQPHTQCTDYSLYMHMYIYIYIHIAKFHNSGVVQ